MTHPSHAHFVLFCEESLPSGMFCPKEGYQNFWTLQGFSEAKIIDKETFSFESEKAITRAMIFALLNLLSRIASSSSFSSCWERKSSNSNFSSKGSCSSLIFKCPG